MISKAGLSVRSIDSTSRSIRIEACDWDTRVQVVRLDECMVEYLVG